MTVFVGAAGIVLLVGTGLTKPDFVDCGTRWVEVGVGVEVEAEVEVEVEVERVWASTGSAGVSMPLEAESLCSPIGLRGSRSVPLFGTGVIPTESQSML